MPDGNAMGAPRPNDAKIVPSQDRSDPAPGGASPPELTPDTAAAIDFLRSWEPDGPWLLVSIVPDGKPTGGYFMPTDEEECWDWIESRQGQENIYFHVNRVAEGYTQRKKAEKDDIALVRWLHIDIDPANGKDFNDERVKALAALQGYKIAPTVIIDSGGGYQGFWKLKDPVSVEGDISKREEMEAYNTGLLTALGGDKCQNVDRIMRLPGTINVPNARKIEKKRKPALAKLVEFNEFEYPLAVFTPVQGPSKQGSGSRPTTKSGQADTRNLPKLNSVDEIPGISDYTKMLIVRGCDPDDPTKYASRSELLFRVVCDLVRADVSDDMIASVLLDPDFGVSASVLEKPRPEAYAKKQIDRARDQAIADFEPNGDKPPAPNRRNFRVALRKLGCEFRRNELTHRDYIVGLDDYDQVNDEALAHLRFSIAENYGIRFTRDDIREHASLAARDGRFHPVRDYLSGLTWDGTPRIEQWLIRHAGAEDTPFVRAVSRLMLIAAVRRAHHPGCKFDTMLVLEGGQGVGKSSALKVLAKKEEWFSDQLPLGEDERKTVEALSGKWIIESGELAGLRKGEVEKVKAQLSRSVDRARMSYARLAEDYPRQCVFFGSTNNEEYLTDPTGSRRFWPVRVGSFNVDGLRSEVDQLWAEAAHAEAEGASLELPSALWSDAKAEQDKRHVSDAWEDVLAPHLGELTGRIRSLDVWKLLGLTPDKMGDPQKRRIAQAMKALGWQGGRRQHFPGAGTVTCYTKGSSTHWLTVRGQGDVVRVEMLTPRPDNPEAEPF